MTSTANTLQRLFRPATRRNAAALALATMIAAPSLHAATGNWNVDANTSGWGTASNWAGGIIPNAVDDVANFSFNLTAARTILLDGSRTVGAMTVGDPTTAFGAYTFSANGQGGQLIFDVSSGNANLTISAATTAINVFNVPIVLNDSLTIHSLQNEVTGTTFNGNISGTGGLTLTADGTHPAGTASTVGAIVLNGVNTYAGGTTVQEGSLRANNAFAVGTGAITIGSSGQVWFNFSGTVSNNITVNGLGWNIPTHGPYGALRSDGTSTFTGAITLGSESRFQGASTGVNTLSGAIGESAAGTNLQFNELRGGGAAASASTWILNNTGTYTGKTTVNAGTLRIGTGGTTGSLGATSNLEFANANIEFRRSDNVTVTTPFTQLTGTQNGIAITGSNFIHSGTGVLTIDNAGSAYLGTTAVSGLNGKLVFGTGGAHVFSGAGTITLTNGADIEFNTSSAVSLGTVTGVAANDTFVIQSGTGTTTLGGAVDNGNGAAIVNGGTLVLGKASTAAIHSVGAPLALVVNGGTARLGSTPGGGGGDQIFNSSDVQVNTTGTLDLNGTSETIDVLGGSGGIVSNSAAATTSTLTVGSANSAVNVLSPIAYNSTFGGVIEDGAGTVAVTKTGTGLQTLSGANTYTGATTIGGGTLSITGSTLSTGAVAVNSTGTLSGTGSVGNVTMVTGGAIRPGATNLDVATGTLTMNSLAVSGGDIRLGVGTDLISVTNLANFTAASTLTPTFSTAPALGQVNLLTAGTLTAGTMPTLTGVPATTRSTFGLLAVGNSLVLDVTGASAKSLTWTDGNSNGLWNLNSSANFDAAGAETFFNLDAVTFGDGPTIRSINLAAGLVPSSVTVNNSTGNDYTFQAGSIAGGGASLTKTGTGTLFLNTANTFSGPVTITGGTIKAGNATALGDANGTTTISGGGTLDMNGQNVGAEVINLSGSGVGGAGALVNTSGSAIVRFLNLTGNATIGGTARFDVGSAASGLVDLAGFTLTKTGSNIVYLANAGSGVPVTSGNIDVQGGTLGFAFAGALVQGTGTITYGPGTTGWFYQTTAANITRNIVVNNATFQMQAQNSGVASNIQLAGNLTADDTGGTLTLTGNISETGGARSIIKANGSGLVLNGNNTFTGNLTLTGGTVNLGGTNTIAGAVSLTSSTLQVLGTATTNASLGNASSISLSASTLTLNLTSNYTLPATTLASTNSSAINFGGQTQGTTLTINSALGATTAFNTLNFNSGTATLASGANVTVGVVGVGGTTLASGNVGTLNIQSGAALTTRTLYLGEGGTNTGFVNQSGGTVTVTATDLGVDGSLRIGHWPGAGATYTLSGGTLNVLNGLTGIGADTVNPTFNISGGTANLFKLVVDARNGATAPIGGTLNLSGGELVIGAGGLVTSANGQTNVSGGTLSASVQTTFSGGMNLANNTPTIDTRGHAVTMSGGLFGPGGFTKAGSGRLTLSATTSNLAGTVNATAGETYLTGTLGNTATTVNVGGGGALFLDGTGGANTGLINGTVNVNSGGTLYGGGTLANAGKAGTLVINGGEVRPGFSVGTLSAGALTMNGGTARFELNTTSNTTGGGVNDLIAVTSGLTFTGGTIIPSFTGIPTSGNFYTLFTSGTLTGLPTVDANSAVSRLAYGVAANGNNVELTVTGTAKSLTWTGANSSVWDLNATQNFTDGAAETFFQQDAVTFDGTAPGAITLTGALQPSLVTVASGSYDLGGTGSVEAGAIALTGGTLGFASGTLGTVGTITIGGGTLKWNGANTQDLSSRLAMVAGTTATFDTNGNNVTFANPLGNLTNSSLAKNGTGTLILANNSTYIGTTTINGGTLQVGTGGNLGTIGSNSGAVSIGASGTLSLLRQGSPAFNNPVSGTGTLEFKGDGTAHSGDYTIGGNNSGFSGSIVVTSARAQLDNANDIGTAAVTVNSGGQLYLTAGTYANAVSLTGTGWQEAAGILGAIRFQGGATWSGPVTLAGNARIHAHGAGDAGTISGAIGGPGVLTKTGLGTITLSGTTSNTQGGTIVNNVGSTAFAPLVLAKTGGALAVPGNLQIGNNTGGYANVNLGASEQIADTGVITFNGTQNNWAYFKTLGFSETVAGLSSPLVGGSPVFGGVIENMEAEVVNTNATLTVNNSADYSYNGYIRDKSSGAGTGTLGFTKLGTGTQTLIGSFITYTGATTVSGGTLSLRDTTAFASATTVGASGTLEINKTVNGFASRTKLTGLISGAGTLNVNNATPGIAGGWVRFESATSGLSNFTGTVNVNSGVLSMDNLNGVFTGNPNMNVASGGLFAIRGQDISMNSLTGSGIVFNSNVNNNAAGRTLTVGAANGGGTFSGVIHGGTSTAPDGTIGQGVLNLSKAGSGTQILTGTNLYGGPTTISGGTLQVGNGGTTGSLGTNTVTNNAALVFDRSNDHVVNNAIGGSGSLTKAGAGTMVLGSSSTYAGATTISGGTLQLGGETALPISAGIQLDATDGTTIVTGGGDVMSWENKGTLGALGNVTALAGQEPTAVDAVINGNRVIRFEQSTGLSSGTIDRLTNGIDFTGTDTTVMYVGRYNGGAQNLRLLSSVQGNWLLGTHAGLTGRGHLGPSAAFMDQGGTATNTTAHVYTGINGANGFAAFSSDGALMGSNINGATHYSAPNGLSLGGGFNNASEFSDGDIGELLVFNSILSEDDRRSVEGYLMRKWKATGTTNVLPTGTDVLLTAPGAALDVNGVTQTLASIDGVAGTSIALGGGSLTTGGDDSSTTFAGAISGAGTVTKTGTGTWTLSGANTNTGDVVVADGTLLVSGSLTGSLTTVNGGTLKGTGTTGALTLVTGTLAPGNSPGILNSGDLNLNGGTLALEINGTTAGSGYDQLNVAGTVTLNGLVALTIDLGVFDPADNGSQSFTIISNNLSDGIVFDFGNNKAFTYNSTALNEGDHFFVGAQDFTISYAGGTNSNDVILTAVPEPGSAASLLSGLALLLGIQRRRRAARSF